MRVAGGSGGGLAGAGVTGGGAAGFMVAGGSSDAMTVLDASGGGLSSGVGCDGGSGGTWTTALQTGQRPARPAQASATFRVCPLGQLSWIDISLVAGKYVGLSIRL